MTVCEHGDGHLCPRCRSLRAWEGSKEHFPVTRKGKDKQADLVSIGRNMIGVITIISQIIPVSLEHCSSSLPSSKVAHRSYHDSIAYHMSFAISLDTVGKETGTSHTEGSLLIASHLIRPKSTTDSSFSLALLSLDSLSSEVSLICF